MEINELKQYLKDVYELESHLFNLNNLKNTFEMQLEEYQQAREGELNGNEFYLGYYSGYSFPTGATRYNRGIKPNAFSGDNLKSAIDSIRSYRGWNLDNIWPQKWEDTNEFKNIVEAGAKAQKKYDDSSDEFGANGILIGMACAVIFVVLFFINDFDFIKTAIFTIIIFAIMKFINGRLTSRDFGLHKIRNDLYVLLQKYYEEDMKKKYEWTNDRCIYIAEKYKNEIIPSIIEVENTLKKVYSQNIIHPKYRDFVAVAQMYEYIDTGRCSELEGPDGAYNLFESELRQNLIIEKLDIIIEKLDELNRTMSYIASSIDYTNVLLSNVCNSLNTIETNTAITASNSALTAYNTQCTAYNSEMMRRYS